MIFATRGLAPESKNPRIPQRLPREFGKISTNFSLFFLELSEKLPIFANDNENDKMTAIDLRANTMQILDQFDKADASLWQKVLDAVTSIYKSEEDALHAKRAQQKAKIRQMVGILNEENLDDWKREKEEYLTEKYQ